MNTELKKNLVEAYLDYVNDFLTVEKFADYYGLSLPQGQAVINIGRELHELNVSNGK